MNMILEILFLLIALAVTITVHEAAHAWMANRLGDPTAKLSGRLTLNPLAHYDPVGSTLLLITGFLTLLGKFPFPFGWAKPVPFDPYNLKDAKKDSALISVAGPVANLILAITLSILLRFINTPFSPLIMIQGIVTFLIVINISLAIFNLVPVHPLDGGKILIGLLPDKAARKTELFLDRFGFLILLFLIFPTFGGESILTAVISPLISFLIKILTGNQII